MAMVRLALNAMGTRFELVLQSEDQSEVFLRAAGEAALEEIEEWDRRLSRFRADSLVAQINRTAAADAVRVDAEVFGMLQVAELVYRESGGAFDITVGPLMEAMGFHGSGVDADAGGGGEVVMGMEHLVLDIEGMPIGFLRDGMAIDLGGIAKGFALDCAGVVLREAGIECGLLHGGTSTILGMGSPPSGEGSEDGWAIEIFDPMAEEGGAEEGGAGRVEGKLVVNLKDAVLSVSAAHGRMVEGVDGLVRGHVMDPRRGVSVSSGGFAAAMVGEGGLAGTLADAWSTALLVLGARPLGMSAEITTMVRAKSAERGAGRYTVRGPLRSLVERSMK